MLRLENDLKNKEGLAEQNKEAYAKYAGEESKKENIEALAKAAADLGYQITIADFERAKVMDEELDPEELEKVSGGAWGWCWSDKYCFAIEDLRW